MTHDIYDDMTRDHMANHPVVHPHHHHHGHRHAPHCDDQLPTFSHVGRGIKGDSFRVRVSDPDSCIETYLIGESYDEATKTWTTEWQSENINGGELSYAYNFKPNNDPQTFNITFVYRRPHAGKGERVHNGPNEATENCVHHDATDCCWSWTTPDIPYFVDTKADGTPNYDGFIGSGVATLYIKNASDKNWREKLVYPPGTDGSTYNAPDPLEPWSVNLEFGIGGDLDIPTLDDLAKIIGCTPGDIKNIIKGITINWDGVNAKNLKDYINNCDKRDRDHFHKDLGFNTADGHSDTGAFNGVNNVKAYIDGIVDDIDVTSLHTDLLGVKKTKGDHASGVHGTKFELDPIELIAGNGIKITKKNGQATFEAGLNAGPGIQIEPSDDGNYTITNTQVGGKWKTLKQGDDYEYTWHNGWFLGPAQNTSQHQTTRDTSIGPKVRVIVSRNVSGDIVGADVRVTDDGGSEHYLCNSKNIYQDSNFKFRHSDTVADVPESAIVSIKFKGEYADINNLSLNGGMVSTGSNVWNVKGTTDSISTNGADWKGCGASWMVNCSIHKDVSSSSVSGAKTFLIAAVNISDGWNGQYSTPGYSNSSGTKYSVLAIRPYANFDWRFSLTK